MNAIRSGALTSLMICLPLLIWTWGSIANPEPGANAASIIQQALAVLCCLQGSAILLLPPWFMREASARDCLSSVLLVTILPLPFLILAWLAAALTLFALCKIIAVALCAALAAMAVVMALKRAPLLALPLCVAATAMLWYTNAQWLTWLMR